jgi:hypothetical protein
MITVPTHRELLRGMVRDEVTLFHATIIESGTEIEISLTPADSGGRAVVKFLFARDHDNKLIRIHNIKG